MKAKCLLLAVIAAVNMGIEKKRMGADIGKAAGCKVPRLTTLCYIERNGCWLVIHRNKKQNDENGDKWIGVGGKFEYGESPVECALREVKEETGLTMLNPRFRGLVTFVSD